MNRHYRLYFIEREVSACVYTQRRVFEAAREPEAEMSADDVLEVVFDYI